MKNIVVFLVLVVSLASCASKNGFDLAVSSNETKVVPDLVESWINNNLDEVLQLREFFTTNFKNELQIQEGIEKFTPFQMQALWVGKFLEVLELDWTEAERQHIRSILEFMTVNPLIFSREIECEEVREALVMVNNWGENWGAYAINELGWDSDLLYAMVETLVVMNEDKKIDPKFKRVHQINIDGVLVPHVMIDGAYVRLDSLE